MGNPFNYHLFIVLGWTPLWLFLLQVKTDYIANYLEFNNWILDRAQAYSREWIWMNFFLLLGFLCEKFSFLSKIPSCKFLYYYHIVWVARVVTQICNSDDNLGYKGNKYLASNKQEL